MSHEGSRLGPLVRLLWGADSAARLIPDGRPVPDGHVIVDSFVVLPSLQRPRLLLPAAAPTPARARLLRAHNEPPYVGPRTMLPALRKALQVEPLSSMAGPKVHVVLPVEQGELTLRHVVGRQLRVSPRELVLSLSMRDDGTRPTIRVTGLDGVPLLFLKVADAPLRVGRLGQEQDALRALQLAPAPGIRASAPLVDLHWHGRRVTGVAALPLDPRPGTRPAEATSSALSDLQASQPMTLERLRESAWLHELRDRVEGAPKPMQEPLHSHLDRITKHYGHTFYALGRTHGDWLPWHMAWTDDGDLAVWDWEHSHAQAPLLLDTLHWHHGIATVLRNRSVASGVSSVRQHVRTMSSAPPGLAPVYFAEHAVRRAAEVLPGDLASREIALRALRALSLAY